jgi:O-antigen/teichoic acid export membrane protein
LKKYILYGSSILFSRGLEYIILLIAPLILAKDVYGSLEFYKKTIELGAAFFTFGLPTILLTYPKSNNSKLYFNILSLLFIVVISFAFVPLAYVLKFQLLIIPIIFHSLFFNNGIIPPFILTRYGSGKASIYKSAISFLFYSIILLYLYFGSYPEFTFVYVNYYLLPVCILAYVIVLYKQQLNFRYLKHYLRVFKKLLFGSFTLLVSNFANMMFLYTDIFIIKVLSSQADIEIADYSFALNISNALMLVPLTLVQVDIEKLKKSPFYYKSLNKKILGLVLIAAIILAILFYGLTHSYFNNYANTWYIFIVILGAKIMQSFSVLFGAKVIIKKLFKQNLIINLFALILNVMLSWLLYKTLGMLGIAISSLISLFIRYVLLRLINIKYTETIK